MTPEATAGASGEARVFIWAAWKIYREVKRHCVGRFRVESRLGWTLQSTALRCFESFLGARFPHLFFLLSFFWKLDCRFPFQQSEAQTFHPRRDRREESKQPPGQARDDFLWDYHQSIVIQLCIDLFVWRCYDLFHQTSKSSRSLDLGTESSHLRRYDLS